MSYRDLLGGRSSSDGGVQTWSCLGLPKPREEERGRGDGGIFRTRGPCGGDSNSAALPGKAILAGGILPQPCSSLLTAGLLPRPVLCHCSSVQKTTVRCRFHHTMTAHVHRQQHICPEFSVCGMVIRIEPDPATILLLFHDASHLLSTASCTSQVEQLRQDIALCKTFQTKYGVRTPRPVLCRLMLARFPHPPALDRR